VQEDKKNRGRRAMQRRRFLVFIAVFCLRWRHSRELWGNKSWKRIE